MSGALVVLGGIAYIALSIFFKFTPRLRVVVGLLVGGMLAGIVTSKVNGWLADAIDAVARPLGRWIGQSTHSVAVAIPTVIAFALGVVIVVFLRGRGKGGGGGHGGGKHGGGGGKANLAHAALVCALLLPMVAGSIGELIRSVSK